MLRVQGAELFYTIDAIRAVTGALRDGSASIARTNAALGIDPTMIGSAAHAAIPQQ